MFRLGTTPKYGGMEPIVMDQHQLSQNTSQVHDDSAGLSALDIMIVLAKYKRSLVVGPIAAAAAAVALSFALPTYYSASTKLLPPQQQQGGAAAVLAQLGGVASMATGVSGLKSPSDMYIGMLKSRTIADRLIKKFNLKEIYQSNSQEHVRNILQARTTINNGKDGLITIEVEAKDKKLAPQLADGYVAELLELTKVLAVTEAAQRRMFFERQLEAAKDNLAKAEMTLKNTLDVRGVINVDTESRAILETIARLRAQVSAKEIQLSSMNAFVTSNNPAYKRAAEELSSLKAELSRLENGRSGPSDASGNQDAKQSGFESIKTLRDVKYYQMLYELLAKQYEAARLDEAKDNSVIQVLDPAVEPEGPSTPKRIVILAVAIVLGFFAALGRAFFKEAKARMMTNPEQAKKWRQFQSFLRLK